MTSVILKSINRNSEAVSIFKSFEVKIDLPITLGRGPVIKCPDKKISRNHVMIDWDDEGVLVTSTNPKPTFVLVNDEEKCLVQGQYAVLKNGDCFGLLKENFWYKVVVASSCSDERVTESKIIHEESSPSLSSTESPTDKIEKKSVEVVEKEQKKSSPCLSSAESPQLDQKYNKPIDAEKKKVSQILEKDPDVIDENVEPLMGDNNIREANKIEDGVEETDGKRDEIEGNLSETNYNPINNRKRALPTWMGSQAKNLKSNEKKSSEKIKNVNENNSKKRNTSRPSKKGTSLSKFHECSDDDDDDDHDRKISPKKETNRVRRKPTKNTKAKNQYHSVSQDVDSQDFEIDKVNTKANNDANIHNVSDDFEVLPKKIIREKQKQIKETKAKNQYHSVSQDFDSPDFETERNVSESEATSKNTLKANSSRVSDSEEVKSKMKEHNLSDDDDGGVDNDESSRFKPTKIKISQELKKNSPRKSCQYGEGCYRQNPKHRKDMAHPGDSDYVSHDGSSDDEDDDRPECEFGLNCYRKNPQHKKDFKHTKKPQPPRNAKKKARRGNDGDDSDSSNEYDFDDPFLNDDSSDDYAPTPTSSGPDSEIEDADEEEDTHRTLYEGKKFVKKRKR